MKAVILLSISILLTLSQHLRLSASRAHMIGKKYLSHSREAFFQAHHNLRHRLSNHLSYEQLPLYTNHVAFKLKLEIQGFEYLLNMDTGSSDFFIKGEDAPGIPSMDKRYRSKQNYEDKPVIWIAYLDGPLKTYEDILNVQFNNQRFEAPLLVAYTAPAQFLNVEGIIGLSFPSKARHQPTFIQTLMKNNLISKYAYGMNLNLIQDQRSFVSFGSQDHQLFEGELKQYDMSSSSSITIQFGYITIGQSKRMNIKQALLDTGNTCISIPIQHQEQIINAFNTENNKCMFSVEQNVPMFSLLLCKINNFDELPEIKLSIQGDIFSIEKQYYLQGCKQDQNSGSYFCQTYIQTSKEFDDERVILGDGFFNRFYTYFDLEEKKVGIAKNKQNISISDVLELEMQYDPLDWQWD